MRQLLASSSRGPGAGGNWRLSRAGLADTRPASLTELTRTVAISAQASGATRRYPWAPECLCFKARYRHSVSWWDPKSPHGAKLTVDNRGSLALVSRLGQWSGVLGEIRASGVDRGQVQQPRGKDCGADERYVRKHKSTWDIVTS